MKRWTRILAITIAGALLLSAIGVGVVLAADPTSPSNPTTPTQPYSQLFLEKLAARLGVTVDKYNEAVKGARLDVLNQQVKDGRLTQDQANQIQQRWDKAPAGASGFGMGPGMMGPRGGMRGGTSGTNWTGPRADCPCN